MGVGVDVDVVHVPVVCSDFHSFSPAAGLHRLDDREVVGSEPISSVRGLDECLDGPETLIQ